MSLTYISSALWKERAVSSGRKIIHPATAAPLNGITIVCRFRSAFLEYKSDLYHTNFRTGTRTPQAKAKELLMELYYLRSEAIHANLEKPGMWLKFMGQERLDTMLQIWRDVDLKSRDACGTLLALSRDATASDVDVPIRRIDTEVRPFNTELGYAIAHEMQAVFKFDKRVPLSQNDGRETPSGAPDTRQSRTYAGLEPSLSCFKAGSSPAK
jgi:hypothetical protein